jgi:hypothetical protein
MVKPANKHLQASTAIWKPQPKPSCNRFITLSFYFFPIILINKNSGMLSKWTLSIVNHYSFYLLDFLNWLLYLFYEIIFEIDC